MRGMGKRVGGHLENGGGRSQRIEDEIGYSQQSNQEEQSWDLEK